MDMSNKVIIRLNIDAMNALFPEGTEARVDLQAAVLREAAGRHVKGQLTDEMRRIIDKRVKEISSEFDVDAEIRKSFTKTGRWADDLTAKPGTPISKAIQSAARMQVEDHIASLISASVKRAVDGLSDKIEDSVSRIADRLTRDEISKKVRERLQSVLD